jgi:ribosomal protein S14
MTVDFGLTRCGRCGEAIGKGEPRAIVRDAMLIVTLCPACVNREYANAADVPLYTSQRDYEKQMIAKYGKE